MRILAIDFGTKRIGLAMSDPMGIIASPLEVYKRRSYRLDVAYVLEIIKKYDINKIIVGRTRQESEVTKLAEEFVTSLGIKAIWVDEVLTSHEAREIVGSRKEIDDVAAAIMLRDYLTTIGGNNGNKEN